MSYSMEGNDVGAHVERLQQRVKELEGAIEQLKQNSPSCPACAEAFWCGSIMSGNEHTCHAAKDTEIAQLKQKLLFAEDAAAKGEAGRTLGTAYEGALQELEEWKASHKDLMGRLDRYVGDYDELCELRKERDQLKAQVATMREALRDAEMFIETFYIDWARFNHGSPDYDPNYKPEFPPIVAQLEKARATTAGNDLLAELAQLRADKLLVAADAGYGVGHQGETANPPAREKGASKVSLRPLSPESTEGEKIS